MNTPGQNSGDNSGRFKKGQDTRRAVGRKGIGGRKPLEFKSACAGLADDVVLPKVQAYLGKAKADPADPAWRWCAEYVTGYSKQKPTEKQTHEGEVVIRIVRGAKAG